MKFSWCAEWIQASYLDRTQRRTLRTLHRNYEQYIHCADKTDIVLTYAYRPHSYLCCFITETNCCFIAQIYQLAATYIWGLIFIHECKKAARTLLTNDFHLQPGLRMRGALPPLPHVIKLRCLIKHTGNSGLYLQLSVRSTNVPSGVRTCRLSPSAVTPTVDLTTASRPVLHSGPSGWNNSWINHYLLYWKGRWRFGLYSITLPVRLTWYAVTISLRLVRRRNIYEHFLPGSWSLPLSLSSEVTVGRDGLAKEHYTHYIIENTHNS